MKTKWRSVLQVVRIAIAMAVTIQSVSGFAQDDDSFREFDANTVPTPAQLYRALAAYQPTEELKRQANEAKLKQLEESGRKFFSSLSPEQKAKALQYAEKFLRENGVDSARSRSLMNQFGIPPELQDALAQRYRNLGQSGNQSAPDLTRLLEIAKRNASQGGPGKKIKNPYPGSKDDKVNQPLDLDKKLLELTAQAENSVQPGPKEITKANKSINDSPLKDFLSRTKKALSNSADYSSIPKERLTAKVDRLLVEAAKRTLEAKMDDSPDTNLVRSVDSMWNKVIDEVHDSVTNQDGPGPNSGKTLSSELGRGQRTEQLDSDVSPQVVRNDNRSGDSPKKSMTGESADGSWKLPGFPSMDWKAILMGCAVVALGLLLVWFAWQSAGVNSSSEKSRRFGKKFRHAKIRSPQDLVEAVDFFLVSKFGSESRWWHAGHARDVLSADAPEFSAKISDLIKDYVRARYMRKELLLSDGQQRNYKLTLQELSKLQIRPALVAAPELANEPATEERTEG